MDKLPKDCFECPFFTNSVNQCCYLDRGFRKDYHKLNQSDDLCPLKKINFEGKKKDQRIKGLRESNIKKAQKITELRKVIRKLQSPKRLDDKTIKDIKHTELLKICKRQKQELEKIKSSFGKFKSVGDLLKSYHFLEKAYTQSQQELKEIKRRGL